MSRSFRSRVEKSGEHGEHAPEPPGTQETRTHLKIGMHEPSISKIDRVIVICVSQGDAKSQFLKILKSKIFAQYLKFLHNLHMSSNSK